MRNWMISNLIAIASKAYDLPIDMLSRHALYLESSEDYFDIDKYSRIGYKVRC